MRCAAMDAPQCGLAPAGRSHAHVCRCAVCRARGHRDESGRCDGRRRDGRAPGGCKCAPCHAARNRATWDPVPRGIKPRCMLQSSARAVKLVTDAKAAADFGKRVTAWKDTTARALNAVRTRACDDDRLLRWLIGRCRLFARGGLTAATANSQLAMAPAWPAGAVAACAAISSKQSLRRKKNVGNTAQRGATQQQRGATQQHAAQHRNNAVQHRNNDMLGQALLSGLGRSIDRSIDPQLFSEHANLQGAAVIRDSRRAAYTVQHGATRQHDSATWQQHGATREAIWHECRLLWAAPPRQPRPAHLSGSACVCVCPGVLASVCVRASARARMQASVCGMTERECVCVCVCACVILCVRSVLTDAILKRATNAESVRTHSHRCACNMQRATHPTYNRQHAPASAQHGLPLSTP
jgi:hypothetical protein